MRTVAEIQADITTLEGAMTQLMLGRRITTLITGSGAFQRRYTYQEITVENLRGQLSRLRDELMQAQSELTGVPVTPTFRTFGSLRMTVSKGTQRNRGGY